MLYYDYNADFPQGNGWLNSESNYKGEIIDSPDYIFSTGKYKGKSLQYIVEYCWRGIIKYIDYGLIFITNNCLNHLHCSPNKLSAIKAANDSKLYFCQCYDVTDELYTKPLACSYQEESFLNVAEKDPRYLIQVINRGLYPKYGRNQRFYAKDNGLTMLVRGNNDAESVLKHHIMQLKQKGVATVFVSYAEDLLENLKHMRNEFQEEQMYRMQQEFDEQDIEDGYRAAFEDDPEAIWNID